MTEKYAAPPDVTVMSSRELLATPMMAAPTVRVVKGPLDARLYTHHIAEGDLSAFFHLNKHIPHANNPGCPHDHTGCPIWSSKGWVGNFYPEGTRPREFLREYARRLTTIEGNTSFYAVPTPETVENWVADTPETFRFCPKIPKAISHEGNLVDNIPRAREFVEIMRGLGIRLGPRFLQLPPRFPPHLKHELQSFLSVWPQDVRLAVEVRSLDWFDPPHTDELNRLLSNFNMARVTIDTRPFRDLAGDEILEGTTYGSLVGARERKPDLPVIPTRTTDFVFIRYIGHPDLHFNDPFLDEWGNYLVSELRTGAEDAYVFCHSPDNLTAPQIARALHRRVSEKVEIPELPWNEIDKDQYEQGGA